MTFKEITKILEKDGWYIKNINASHYQYIHPVKKGKVTVPRHGNKDLSVNTIKSIYKQAKLK